MSITGDLRFASHHDTMRAVERLMGRAKLPIAFSQGFNPRPVLSLAVPRPVGVATRDDRVVAKFTDDRDPADVLDALNRHAPRGMSFLDAWCLAPGEKPVPQRVAYTATLPADQAHTVVNRINELQQQDTWPVERRVKPKRRRDRKSNDAPRTKTIDLKPRINALSIDGAELHMETLCSNAAEARPVDVLDLLGLEPRTTLARLVRTGITDNTRPPR